MDASYKVDFIQGMFWRQISGGGRVEASYKVDFIQGMFWRQISVGRRGGDQL